MQGTISTHRWLLTLGVLAVLFASLMSAGAALTPDPVRAQAEPGQFDARASRERLARLIGQGKPHPVDSAENDAVRERLLQEIRDLGFSPDVREAFTCRPRPNAPSVECARVRNVMFSIGPNDAPAVLAASHYDSVSAGPGASDDGLGVSIWLEIARMLAREPLRRRVIFFFSDGEEQGLLGAYAFANGDPLMEEVESLVDLEARGSRGLALFFESNQPNADAVVAYSDVPRPAANSVMADVYRLLPNSTDVTVLTRPGLDVVNIAVLDGLEDYHTPQDTIASQDLRSVQHMGDAALAVTRRLAGASDADVATPMAYTDIASRLFIYAPVWAVLAALALSGLLSFVAFWGAGADGRWRAFAAPPLAVIVAGVLAFAGDFIIRLLRPGEDYAFAYPEPTRAWCILLAFAGAALSLMTLRAARTPQLIGAAAMFWFVLIGGLASIVTSGISILFALPALTYALSWLASLAWKPAEAVGRWLAAIVVVIVWAPTLYLVELALGFDLPFAFTILATLMLLPCLGVLAAVQGETSWGGVTAVTVAAAFIALVVAGVTPSRSEMRPQPLNLSYFYNTSDNEARLVAGSAERALPPQLRDGFRPETLIPGDRVDTWAAPADVERIPAPVLDRMVVAEDGGERIVRGRLAMNGVYRATLRVPPAARPLRVSVNGADADIDDADDGQLEFMSIACQGRACDGAEIEIVLAVDGATDQDWFIIGQTPGAQVAAAHSLRARRPPTTTQIQFGDSAITLSRFRPGG